MILLLLACKGPSSTATPTEDTGLSERQALLAGLAEDVVAPRYAELVQRAAALEEAADTFCADRTAPHLATLRTAWWDARAPWKRMEVVNFGPVVDQPWRVGPLLDFWPVRDTVVDDLLAGEDALTVAYVSSLGASTRGFPVLEYVLWPEDDLLEVFDDRRCAYTTALAADLHANAVVLQDAWATYTPGIVRPSEVDSLYDTPQDVLDEWVNRMFFTVEDLRFEKLGKPLGDDSGGTPLPDAAESPFSGRSLADARDALAGVRDVWEGGVRGFLPADSDALITNVESALTDAETALAAVPEPLTATVVDDRASVQAAQDALRVLQIALQIDLAQALSVTIAFNDNDGD